MAGGTGKLEERRRRRVPFVLYACALLAAAACAAPAAALAESASDPSSLAAGRIDAGRHHTCAVLSDGTVRCWGFSAEGALGYGDPEAIGDNESPSLAGAVKLGAARSAVALAAGDFHTCALLDDGDVRCWGYGGDGRLGYASEANIGDDEDPGSRGPVNLGPGRTAKAITAGGAHTCAILDNDELRCWGYGFNGQLGYGDASSIGDTETPGSAGPVNLGPGRTPVAVAAGSAHTCAILDDGAVRCWGAGLRGQLGYGNTSGLGDFSTPDQVPPVSIGAGRKAEAVSAALSETCVLLDDGTVRCWGAGEGGRLGYGNSVSIGDTELPDSVAPVNLGAARTADAIAVGGTHVCAVLDRGDVRCWGYGSLGQLGYASTRTIGDDEAPGSVGPVKLGAGRGALALALGDRHSCARLDDGEVRCWGYGGNGRLGYCNESNIGDDEAPASSGPVGTGDPLSAAPGCPPLPLGRATTPQPRARPTADPSLVGETARAAAYRRCTARAASHARREIRRARRLPARRRAKARRHVESHRRRLKRACARQHGRTPGRVTGLTAKVSGRTRIVLAFRAAGTDGSKPPPARTYVVKQSRRGGANGLRRTKTLCNGRCRFSSVAEVGATLSLTVRDLRPGTTYLYAVAARDNVSGRAGPSSRPARATTRR
jgi:alpha-tubulin suppressor-like RCC1 family protein